MRSGAWRKPRLVVISNRNGCDSMTYQEYKEAAAYLRDRMPFLPKTAVVLGSGLGPFAEQVMAADRIPYGEIPHFPRSTVASHKGELICGTYAGEEVLVMSGRFHFYEGYRMEEVAFPVRVFHLLGVETLILTNAAGGINLTYRPGEFMLITDHIKLFDDSPARGPHLPEFGQRFFDLSEAYALPLRELARETAAENGIPLREGVYAFMPGPQFETPAEIRALRTLGADAVGMSTVPEVIAANQCGIRVLGISCISNMAAGILKQAVSDDEVVEVAGRVSQEFTALVGGVIKRLSGEKRA